MREGCLWQRRCLLLTLAVAISGILLLANHCDAEQVQRMMLVAGQYSFGGDGTAAIRSRCLDRFAEAPPQGYAYKFAPVEMGTASITTGSGATIPLGTALEDGLVTIEGLGDDVYTSLRIRNIKLSGPLTLTVSAPTVLMPDRSYPTFDLKQVYETLAARAPLKPTMPLVPLDPAFPPEWANYEDPAIATADNMEIWSLRDRHAGSALTADQQAVSHDARISAAEVLYLNALAALNPQILNVRRLSTPRGPVHVAIGKGLNIVTRPYGSLRDVVSKFVTNASSTDTLSFSISGDDSVKSYDLDLTTLMLAVASIGTVGEGIRVTYPSGYRSPPEGWEPAIWNAEDASGGGGLTSGPPSEGGKDPNGPTSGRRMLTMASDRGPYQYTETFLRGKVTAVDSQEIRIVWVARAIHQFLISPKAKNNNPQETIAELKSEIKAEVGALYASAPMFRGLSDHTKIYAVVDGVPSNFDAGEIERYLKRKDVKHATVETTGVLTR